MSALNLSCAQCSHPVLSSFKDNFSLLHSALDETTSTLATLLGTNNYPNPDQYAILRASRGKVENALQEIDIIIEHLEHERRLLHDIQESHRRVMSPVCHLPAEILSQIFALSTSSFYDVFGPNLMEGPWALSKVCSQWRAVAIGCCPEIWKNMNIAFNVDPRDPEALLRLVFSRCRAGPLHIRIGYVDNVVIDLLSMVMEESRRWSSFEVYYPNPQLMDALGAVRGNLDTLESLSLRLSNDPGQGLITTFEIAPSLKTVELIGQTGEMRVSLPFSQLVSYIDDSYPPAPGVSTAEYFLNILKKSPRLLKFHAGCYTWFPGQYLIVHPVVEPPIVHESLEELSSYDPALLRSILLPELRVVKMEIPDGGNSLRTPLLALHELVVKSSCSLTSLTLRNIGLGDRGAPYWRDVLDLTPSLTKLEVVMRHGFGTYTMDFLSGLAKELAEKREDSENPPRHDIVPLLTDLTIEVADAAPGSIVYYSFLNCDFVDMVASRYHSAALRRVRVVAKSNGGNEGIDFWKFGNDEFKRMKELRTDGLKIYVFEENGRRGEQIDRLVIETV
ncbi:uncharacterized protein ARMOST_00523 [Armillaria ostoyae]|uniref:Uncharacterized protein n=1 Tax=Armillaria ostoyae TaxID=47428 RepID=A0A284QLE5_ARMOS|nr:uncharacterized protein ARMOST_00523 [Armillaria ostoyae]